MQEAINAVAHFHKAKNVDRQQKFPTYQTPSNEMHVAARVLHSVAETLKRQIENDDLRYLRGHLIIEEFAEMIEAFAWGNEAVFLDGMADLLYVCFGTAVAYDLPLVEAFNEVHRSNMTKELPNGSRVEKSDGYSPADIAKVLREYRDNSPIS